jgi:uncharacterized protein YcbX
VQDKGIGVVGRVVGLWRYPVKSMAGEGLTEAHASWHGFAGDRRWAFIRNDVPRSGFPWLTLRENPRMSHYQPSFADPAQPEKSATLVRTPAGAVLDVTDPALGEELCAPGVRVIKQDRGIFDTFPLSLITVQTIEELGRMTGLQLEVARFRPNIVVDAAGAAPFTEDQWVGRVLRIGDLEMRIDKRDGRCAVIAIDPRTTERQPEVLRVVTLERGGCLGVYGTTITPGRVLPDDAVRIQT